MIAKFKPIYGTPDPLPMLINLPPGAKTAKLRFRQGNYATVAIRYHDGHFDMRFLSWSADGESMEPGHPIGANMHSDYEKIDAAIRNIIKFCGKYGNLKPMETP